MIAGSRGRDRPGPTRTRTCEPREPREPAPFYFAGQLSAIIVTDVTLSRLIGWAWM
jgi:hypothetical protein